MTKRLIFKAESVFKNVTYDLKSDNWFFSFSNNIAVTVSGFWRLIISDKIILVSRDNGQLFGQSEPLDLVTETKKLLANKLLSKLVVAKDTGDLVLYISEKIKIEVFISSIGYETYSFLYQGKRYIGLGAGSLGIVEKTEKPKIFTTRKL